MLNYDPVLLARPIVEDCLPSKTKILTLKGLK